MSKKNVEKTKKRHTFGLLPRRTVFRSFSSSSASRIFLTTSASCVSGAYRRFAGVDVATSAAADFWVVDENARRLRGGEPGGVVDSTNHT